MTRHGRQGSLKAGASSAEPQAVLQTTSRVQAAPVAPSRWLVAVFGGWSLIGSMLLFWMELMVAKMLLPRFGGSASVWNTALVFFQVNLLLGYLAAHYLARLDSRRHKVIQAALAALPLLALPIVLPPSGSAAANPAMAVVLALTVMVGAPFFVLSTASPTLQAWFAKSGAPRANDPYFLYGLSNLGSVLGLLGYPLVIERLMPLRAQAIWWTGGYVGFVFLTIAAARLVGSWETSSRIVTRVAWKRRLIWAATAFVPSLALLGVTRHLSVDVAAFPLLWTIPLAIYLASFMVAFRTGGERWTKGARRSLRLLLVPAVLLSVAITQDLWLSVSLPLAVLAALAIAAHGSVYSDRPDTGSLTDFYLWVSLGGAAGGLFAALLAPAVFDFLIEYPLALALAGLFAAGRWRSRAPDTRLVLALVGVCVLAGTGFSSLQVKILTFGLAGIIAVMWLDRRWFALSIALISIGFSVDGTTSTLATERTFFGIYRVEQVGELRQMFSGNTSHGGQLIIDGTGSTAALSYYHAGGPVGDVFDRLAGRPANLDVGVIGLGVGSTASFGRQGDAFTFYEIDPAVEAFAADEDLFTLLAQSRAEISVVIEDGRLALERLRPQHDLLMVDAFTSDSIPVHLLTKEAFDTYLGSLADQGRVMVHLSNRHLDLAPVVGRIAVELGASARVKRYAPGPEVEGAAASTWMLVEPAGSEPLELAPDWVEAPIGPSLWTDEYSNILSVLHWR